MHTMHSYSLPGSVSLRTQCTECMWHMACAALDRLSVLRVAKCIQGSSDTLCLQGTHCAFKAFHLGQMKWVGAGQHQHTKGPFNDKVPCGRRTQAAGSCLVMAACYYGSHACCHDRNNPCAKLS